MENNFSLHGYDLFGNPIQPEKSGPLAERFEFPPFSVLNAREGEWQDRKRAWISLGIKSGLGRISQGKGTFEDVKNRKNKTEMTQRILDVGGQSIFDPVLCELMYKWFCPVGGQIVDPFAGGSVRGLVAGLLGFKYHGIDLRDEQIQANEQQKLIIAPQADIVWQTGDSTKNMSTAPKSDFIFSCPPYGDLEVYSDLPEDLSTMDYNNFIEAYRNIIKECVFNLKDNRMACFVVGDFRDKKTGLYRGFVADTITAFKDAGMGLYNDAILITCVGSLPIRVSGQFESGRKLGKTHQNILVFAKGDPRKAFI